MGATTPKGVGQRPEGPRRRDAWNQSKQSRGLLFRRAMDKMMHHPTPEASHPCPERNLVFPPDPLILILEGMPDVVMQDTFGGASFYPLARFAETGILPQY